MTIDPQTLRAEPYKQIGALIQRDAGLLIERWSRRAVEEQPSAQRVHREALLNDLPAFLQALGQSLAESQDDNGHCRPAGEHGKQRWEAGWSLTEVVRDYQILRLVILDYLEETLERPLFYREAMAVGLALDEAIAASAGRYMSNREEQIRAQAEALKEADRRKDEFLAVLAHELRNPLAPLRNSAEVLRLLAPNDPGIIEVGDIVERQVKQMVRIVDDLLDVARISQGRLEVRKERVELAAAVGQAVQTSEPMLKDRQHQLSIRLPDEPVWLEADPARLVQVIVNLLNNAARYTDPGGQVWLEAGREGDEAVVRVRDTGVGIPAEMVDRVFEMYTQFDPTRQRSRGGLGIGLTLVRKLLEMHGGKVTASSAGPSQGSEFVVRLPALRANLPAAS